MSAETSADYVRQDVFDPVRHPELFSGVRSRRIFAFFIDVIVIALLTFGAGILVFFLGVFTLGLGFLLYGILPAAVALLYVAFTLGGPLASTFGMRAMGLEMRLWYGAKPYPLLASVHALLFWFSVSLLTPLVLLVSLFSDRKRLLHDMILGVVVINSAYHQQYFYEQE
ncbi:MAG: RDD family protein [Roseibium album]|uniref:RDD family protein n=1 Tax=Roseibium album TaxID=311410 RepID=A0A0M6ZKD9_9HYPH|nr:RDD family protein [Roseibium album]MBG6146894.1 putative RDD family membrane protein YckC [Labrenzia sp. EL_142]MBG6155458.1 putative RDD family membrane protein YckC [Labrenzia sp. EL_162]MBG6193993.1 putative RDD family membrane protein YckC [Labrenzia sp. EL_159]MBG6201031.1 putative RDD family membrane protein YckC [Labrenzia sp. EL_13]MBG6210766.1 putative RDD family membrane protein YckC [Labrenzia sp. EL_126]MCR9056630.1 RDD family protein [Paracoccaceae bacterium]